MAKSCVRRREIVTPRPAGVTGELGHAGDGRSAAERGVAAAVAAGVERLPSGGVDDADGRNRKGGPMIRKLKSGEYRLYSRKKNPKTGRRRNLGTFTTRAAAEKHERAVQYFKHAG